ncbi:MAG: substrate-binding domain-containing protein [Chloroflexota bacterium]
MPNATLRDVARRAGVSYQTVSRVINNHANVADETRQRIQETIVELDYHPNKAARSLAARHSQTLALITFGLDFYGPAQMVVHIERAARNAGYDLIFSNVASNVSSASGSTNASVKSIQAAVNSIRRWQVDGILMITPILEMSYETIARQGKSEDIPIVQINGPLGAQTPSVVVEQRAGSRMITQHLIDLGHRRIAEICGPLTWFDALERHQSWEKTLQTAGLEVGASIQGDWTAQGGYQAAQQLLSRHTDFTALVVGNDQMALGAMRALRETDLRIPEDVSIVGFDDIAESSFMEPPLTTIRQDFAALGKRGIEYLIARIVNPDLPLQQQVIYPEVILRSSTAAPRK